MTTIVNTEPADAGKGPDGKGPDGAVPSGDGAAAIPVLRAQIDAMDEAIVALIAERARLSRRIQTARLNAGGTRVELGRERQILNHYREQLGPEGPALADAVLQVCRGRR